MSSGVVHLPSDDLPIFDELYSISDLHMGGRTGFQIFNAGTDLEAFIEHIRTLPAPRVALVINGDLVDFLAEPDAVAFDPAGAVRKLDRIVGDPAFAPAWRALTKFVRTKGRHLAITLGNHDLELALPWVSDHLTELLTDGDERARGRLSLELDGTGFLCRVGNAKVLCVHGNEVDTWNIADHETIRRYGRDIQQGRAVESWVPNAGTQLVIDVMNAIKQKFPFVDLLKPELEGVIPTLVAIAPEQRSRIFGAFPAAVRLGLDKVRRSIGLLGAEELEEPRPDTLAPLRMLPKIPRISRERLLDATELQLAEGVDPISLVPLDQRGQYLGIGSAMTSFFLGSDVREALRQGLDALQKDRSFEFAEADDTFRQFDDLVGGDVDFLLTGHTHLERALKRTKSRGWYFNSGTWVRLIRLEPNILASADKFAAVYDVLAAGSMAALDKTSGLILKRRTVVMIRSESDGTRGELMRWDEAAGLQAVANTGFTKPAG
jgi:UDP-2,3-diacylglucosamine pyrophosphatase LpxH